MLDVDGRPSGFYAEIWSVVVAELEVDDEIVWVDTFPDLLTSLDDGAADVAVAPLTPTAEREPTYDFTSSVITSGPQLAYHERIATSSNLFSALLTSSIGRILLVAIGGLLLLAHLIWLVERNRDDDRDDDQVGDFHHGYLRGIWDGFWWAAVTVTTVGYGDKAPRSVGGRSVALLAMALSLFLAGAFVSQVTETLREHRVRAPVSGLDDVGGRTVGVVEASSFAAYVADQGVTVAEYPSQADLFEAAERGEVDLVVANPYALGDVGGDHGLVPIGEVFYTEFETFALPQGSPWREPINRVLADLQASGEIDRIVARWSRGTG